MAQKIELVIRLFSGSGGSFYVNDKWTKRSGKNGEMGFVMVISVKKHLIATF